MADEGELLSGVERRSRAQTVSWMASLAVAAGDMRSAEGYLLELMSLLVMFDADGKEVVRVS